MKDKTFTYKLIIVSILIIAGFTIFRFIQTNKKTRNSLPYLTQGEKIKYFDLIGEEGEKTDSLFLQSNMPSLIFIYSRPCNPCNKNIIFWKKIVEILDGDVSVYGIILDDQNEAFSYSRNANLNFKIYVPEDLDRFIEELRIKLNFSQTIVYHKGLSFLKLGELESEEVVNIIKLTKSLI